MDGRLADGALMARFVVIYDLTEPDEPAIAVSMVNTRGEYELLGNWFDDGAYRYREVQHAEFDSIVELTGMPVRRIIEFCISPRDVWAQHEH